MKSKVTITLFTIAIFLGITWFTQDNEQSNADLSTIGWPFTVHRYFSGKVFDPATGMQNKSYIPERSTFFLQNFFLDLLALLLLIVIANYMFIVSQKINRRSRLGS